MYDQREKTQRDHEWALAGAREQGIEQGVEQGVELGTLMGRIQMLQEVLELPVSSDAELRSQAENKLMDLLSTLRQSVRTREA